MNLRFIFLLLPAWLLVPCTILFAGDTRDYYIAKHLNGDNGLPQNSIKSIAPDVNGFIWLATESGLVRYDGRKLKVYNKENAGLWSSRFTYIFHGEDSSTLYALTDMWQLLEIKNSQATRSNKTFEAIRKPFWPRNSFTKGKIGDFAYYHQQHAGGNDSIQFFIGDRHKAILYGDNSIRWDHINAPRYSLGFNADIYRFLVSGNELYYIRDLSPKGLLRLGPDRTSIQEWSTDPKLPAGASFTIFYNDVARQVFLLSGSRLYRLQEAADGILHLRLLIEAPLLSETGVRTFYYDAEADRIYVGTSISGLYIFQRRQFRAMTARVSNQTLNVFYGQMLWNDSSVVTGKGYKFSPHAPATYIDYIGQHADQFGSAIQRYQDGTIFTGDTHNLYRLSADGRKLLSTWTMESPFLIAPGHSGLLWLGTNKGGIYSLHPDSSNATPRLVAPLNEFVTCIQQESAQMLWIGTTSNLYRLHLDTRKWDTIAPLRFKSIRSLYFPAKDELWITTYEDGVFLWNQGRLFHMPMDRNSYLKNAHCIMEDRDHFFWISTNNGLFQAARADLLRYAAGKQASVYYHRYTKDQGFNTNEFNGGGCLPCALRFNQGNSFSFPSLNGLVWFDPASIRPELPGKPIVLDGIQVNGSNIAIRDTLYMEQKSNRINFWIATVFNGNPDDLFLEYTIEGPGTGKGIWNPLVNDFISFNTPRSGTFLLTIRKQSGFGADNYIYKSVQIIVPKAFWESWWFMLLLLIGIIALVLLLIKIRVQLLEKKNKELEQTVSTRTKELRDAIALLQNTQLELSKEVKFQQRLNASITHDIKTPIQYLTLSLKYLFQKKQKQQDPDTPEIADIFQASAHISHFTHSLTGYIKVRLGIGEAAPANLHYIAAQKVVMFSDAAARAHNTLINAIPEGLILVTHAALIDLILHNLIDNAVKHTVSGTIRITAELQEDHMILSVTDTGKGMAEEQVQLLNRFLSEKGFVPEGGVIGLGYFTIADTQERLDGHIRISSKKDEGTRVRVMLPYIL